MNKRGNIIHKTTVQLIISALVIVLFLMVLMGRGTSDEIKRELIQKELAILIGAAEPGTTIELNKYNVNGEIKDIRIEENKIFVDIDNIKSSKGYPIFHEGKITLEKQQNRYLIKIDEK
jgi:hypothetical protein